MSFTAHDPKGTHGTPMLYYVRRLRARGQPRKFQPLDAPPFRSAEAERAAHVLRPLTVTQSACHDNSVQFTLRRFDRVRQAWHERFMLGLPSYLLTR